MKKNRMLMILASALIFALTGCALEPAAPQEIRFHSNDGADSIETQKVLAGQTIVLRANTFVRGDGYAFDGWMATAADGTPLDYADGQEIVMGNASMDLYAHWDNGLLQSGYPVGSAGGFVFYDKRYYSDGWRYMEAAPVSTEWEAEWGASGYIMWLDGEDLPYGQESLAMDLSFGAGSLNTSNIVAVHDNFAQRYPLRGDYYSHPEAYPTGMETSSGPVTGDGSVAAKLCADLVYGYCDDWFLPSLGELGFMYTNIGRYHDVSFSKSRYWSSSEVNIVQAYAIDFSTGKPSHENFKFEKLKIRAARVF